MSQNEEGSEIEWICAWVPCADYPRERERETNRKAPSQQIPKDRKEKVCMHEMCMSM